MDARLLQSYYLDDQYTARDYPYYLRPLTPRQRKAALDIAYIDTIIYLL